MWIEYMEMRNIRSYENARIEFRPGVNFINGANGAGKTTLIEAIGWTLFGSAPYRNMQDYFLRYGQKKGTIVIGICTVQAGKTIRFKIKRLLGNARARSIYEEDEPLSVSGEADVEDYLKQVLELERSERLSALFENVIGVRQGLFTAPFLATAKERQTKFNTILQLDDYKSAADHSKAIVDEIKARIQTIQNEMAHLEGRLADEAETSARYQQAEEVYQMLESEWAAILEQSKRAEQGYREQRERYETWQRAIQVHRQYETEYASAKQNLDWLEQQAEQSRVANHLIQTLQERENLYIEAAHRRVGLEAEKETAEALERMIQCLEQEISRSEEQIKLQLIHAAENEQRANAEMAMQKKKCDQAKTEMLNFQTELVHLETELSEFQQQEAREKEEGGLLHSLQNVWRDIEYLYERIRETQMRIAQAERLVQNKPDLLRQYAEQEQLNQEAIMLNGKQSEINLRIQQWKHDIEKFSKGECPYTRQPCETVVGLEAETKEKLQSVIRQYMQQEEQIAILQQQTQRFAHVQKELAACENEEKICAQEQKNLSQWMAEGVRKIESAAKRMDEDVQNGEQLRKRIQERHIQHEQNTQAIQEKLREQVQKIGRIKGDMESLANIQKESEKRILEQACELEKQKDIRDKMILEENEQKKRKDEWKTLREEKKQFEHTGDELARAVQVLSENEKAHYEYVKNSEIAGRFQADLNALFLAQENEQRLKASKEEAEKTRILAQDAYSAETEKQAEAAWRTAMDQKAAIQARMTEKARERTQIQEKVEKLREVRNTYNEMNMRVKKWRKMQKTAEGCRLVLDRAGERMAQLFREQLGQEADRIHHALSNEPVQLTWEKDYEVELLSWQDGEMRKRSYRALSGGEQMSAGLALRLAMLKQLSTLGIAFFDEPTMNLDASRRQALADILPNALAGFEQVFLVSHDDTFDAITQNIISISKEENGSVVSN